MTFIFVEKFYIPVKDSSAYKFIIHKRLFITPMHASIPALDSIDFDCKVVQAGHRGWLKHAENNKAYFMHMIDQRENHIKLSIFIDKSSMLATYKVGSEHCSPLDDQTLITIFCNEDVHVEAFTDIATLNVCFIINRKIIYYSNKPNDMNLVDHKYFVKNYGLADTTGNV